MRSIDLTKIIVWSGAIIYDDLVEWSFYNFRRNKFAKFYRALFLFTIMELLEWQKKPFKKKHLSQTHHLRLLLTKSLQIAQNKAVITKNIARILKAVLLTI